MNEERGEGMKSFWKACAVLAAVLAFGIGIAACGGSGSSSSSASEGTEASGSETSGSSGEVAIDLGTQTVEVPAGTKPKIGFFAYGLSAYELSYKAEIEKMDGEGYDVTWLEAKYEPATQLKQMQTALTNGTYDAWILEAVDAEGSCRIVSEQAPEQGIVVSMIIGPTCGRALKPWGEEVWAPGTLNLVSDTANVTWFANVFKSMEEPLEIGPGTKIGVINGPDIAAQAQAVEAGVEASGIEPVEIVAGDYTAPTAQKLTQAMLSRNPDIEVILDGYEGATPGIIAALKEAGKSPGEVKLGDIGGSSEISVPNIESGWLTASAAYDPKALARTAIEEVEKAFAGEQVPRFLPADPAGGSLAEPFLLTKENLGSFKPTY
jgi:ABC-type sugar transport system substrate-binding protein